METARSSWTRWIATGSDCSYKRCRQPNRFLFWKRQRGTWMRGGWFCTDDCLEREIESVVEGILFKKRSEPRSHHRIPLGLLMLSRGSLNTNQLETALLKQRDEPSSKIGQWLQRLGYVTERQVVAALALQWGTPVLMFPEENAPQSAIPWELLNALKIMPVRLAPTQGVLYVAFSDPVDHAVLRAIEQMTGWSTSPCIVSDRVMDRSLSKVQLAERDDAHTFENVIEPVEIARIIVSYAGRLGASEVKLAECGPYIWARLKDDPRDSDILFRVSPSRDLSQPVITAEGIPQLAR